MDHNAQASVEHVTNEYRDVEDSHEPVELSQVFKFEVRVGSGNEAKTVVAAGQGETKKHKNIMAVIR